MLWFFLIVEKKIGAHIVYTLFRNKRLMHHKIFQWNNSILAIFIEHTYKKPMHTILFVYIFFYLLIYHYPNECPELISLEHISSRINLLFLESVVHYTLYPFPVSLYSRKFDKRNWYYVLSSKGQKKIHKKNLQINFFLNTNQQQIKQKAFVFIMKT